MKKLFVLCLLTCLFFNSFAQLEKGSWVGGVSGASKVTLRPQYLKAIYLDLNPYAFYLLRNNLALGFNVDNKLTCAKYASNLNIMKSGFRNELSLSPEIRKYFGAKKFRPYVGLANGFEYIYGRSQYEESKVEIREFNYFLAPNVGVSYWLNDKVYLDMKTGFKFLINSSNPNNQSLDLKIGIGIKLK